MTELKFLRAIVSEKRLRLDPAKVQAEQQMELPTNANGVRRYLGMVTDVARSLLAYRWSPYQEGNASTGILHGFGVSPISCIFTEGAADIGTLHSQAFPVLRNYGVGGCQLFWSGSVLLQY